MSISYCTKHDTSYDEDHDLECPKCESEAVNEESPSTLKNLLKATGWEFEERTEPNKMSRVIKFRGKSTTSEHWLVGSLITNYNGNRKSYIHSFENGICEVEKDTVGEYALKRDIDGIDVYEGDILSDRWKVVVYKAKSGAFNVRFTINPRVNKPMALIQWFAKRKRAGTIDIDGEIIGNIHQNPELLNPENAGA